MSLSVVGVGHCTVNYLGVVPQFPKSETKVQLHQFSIQSGGSVATAMAALSSLGVEAAFIGKVSDDHFGDVIAGSLNDLGVNLDGLVRTSGHVSPFTFVLVDITSGKRTLFWSGGDIQPLEVNEVDLTMLEGARYLLVDGYHPAAQIAAARFAKGSKTRVILNVDRKKPGIDELIKLADVLVVSEHFASDLVPSGDLDKVLRELKKHGADTVVITLGGDGCIGIDAEDQIHRVAGKRVTLMDKTGAGYIFNGSLIFGLLQDWTLPEALRAANGAAAHACETLGGLSALPQIEDIARYRSS